MSSPRYLVIGSNGLLGQKIVELLVRGTADGIVTASVEEKPVRELLSVEYRQVDIAVKKDIKRVVNECAPDVIINCAAMTNVDACEKERELCWKINVEGVENIIDAARKNTSMVVHVSSDYIFDGKLGPYAEDDRPEPLSYYGKSKLASENALRSSGIPHFIARSMVLYGCAADVKPNFAVWLVQSLEKNLPVKVVDDQYGNPTLADDLAYGMMRAIELGRTGVYNIAGRDIVNRYEFALALAGVFGFDQGLITPIKTMQLRQPALRPLKSGLITLKAETELGYKPSSIEQGLLVFKNQLFRGPRRLGDSGPVSAQPTGGRRQAR